MRLLILLLLATQAAADPVAGRLETTATAGTCSASLVAPDLALTAAHCLSLDGTRYVLRDGDGTHEVETIWPHPVHALAPATPARYRFDLALAALAAPAGLPPLRPGPPAEPGETLHVETWRRDEGDAPLRRACAVLAAGDLVTLGCAVGQGHSGGPVLRLTEAGPEIVAVLVAKLGEEAALAAPVGPRLGVLLRAAGRD